MAKIKYFKTSYLRKKIKDFFISLCLIDFKIFGKNNGENTLIMTLDALGDNVIKAKTIRLLEEKFGKDKTIILCKSKWKSLYEIQGYKKIFVDESKWNIFYKVKLYRKLNKFGIGNLVILNNDQIPDEEKFIFSQNRYSMKNVGEYILEKQQLLLSEIFGKKFEIDEIVPDIRDYFENKNANIITIGIMASNNKRTLPPAKMENIIKNLQKDFPNFEIHILGVGAKQQNYFEKVTKNLNTTNIVNHIDSISLIETINFISNSKFYIGYDSGLLNVAFALKKKSVCLHWTKSKFIWEHPYSFVKTLKGKGGDKFIDKNYGTDILNSIEYKDIKLAIDELLKGENNESF